METCYVTDDEHWRNRTAHSYKVCQQVRWIGGVLPGSPASTLNGQLDDQWRGNGISFCCESFSLLMAVGFSTKCLLQFSGEGFSALRLSVIHMVVNGKIFR